MNDQRTDDVDREGEPAGLSPHTPPPQSSADLLARVASARGTDTPEAAVQPEGRSGGQFLKGRIRAGRFPSGGGQARFGMRPKTGPRLPRVTAGSPATGVGRGGYRVRRVRRLLRHIEPWSVLKVTLVFYFCVWGLVVISTRMLWGAAEDAGTIAKIENFVEELFTLETFEFDSGQILRVFTLGGLVLVIGGTGVTVVMVVLFNLISDLVGGVRFTMIEEETAVRQRRLRSGDHEVDEATPSTYDPGRGQPDRPPGG
ncbi:MAG: hypothetical protein CL406_02095 [Acidimicrobiaceae bacterium]|nr:hypothetical protein [Acidimicrobiaceae bacterium]MDP6481886.1 DUF3566 domain-containing protein [Acidimicrobiales bacterium]MDP6697714.1 DUF3566 domain-containing protein [Acidimicrobiales bacterium]